MRMIWTAAAALALAAPASATVQAPSRSRQTLLGDIQDVLEFIPPKAQDPVTVRYRQAFQELQAEAKTTNSVADTGRRFDQKRTEYFNAVLAQQYPAFEATLAKENKPHDAQAIADYFHDYVSKRFHLEVILRRLAENKNIHLKESQLHQVDAWRAKLDESNVSLPELNALTTEIGQSYRLRADAQGRYWTGNNLVLRTDFMPRQSSPDRGVEPPAPTAVAAVTPVSFSIPPVVSSLSDFISNVAGKAKVYSRKVADAIVNSSAARNIDASLTTALVWAESEFSHTAGSWQNCLGLGQLSQGVASSYGVRDRTNVEQNLKGTTGFLSSLLNHFTTHDERAYVNGLFAQEAAKVRGGASLDATFARVWPRIPDGMKDAVAAYNAGQGRVDQYGWADLPLPAPRRHGGVPASKYTHLALDGRVDRAGNPLIDRCEHRPGQDNSYCQTMDYVPKVLANYFTVYVQTTPGSAPLLQASANAAPRPRNS